MVVLLNCISFYERPCCLSGTSCPFVLWKSVSNLPWSIPEIQTFSQGPSALQGPFILHMLLASVQQYESEYFYGCNKLKTFPSCAMVRIQLPK